MSWIFNGIFLCMQLFVLLLFDFQWNIPRILNKKLEQNHNKQLHIEEYHIEYSANS